MNKGYYVKILSIVCSLIMILSLTACGSPSGKAASEGTTGTQAATNTTEASFDPMEKYETAITITTVGRTLQSSKYKNDESLEGDNIWNRLYKTYGIDIKYIWSADMSQYQQKVNLAIASGDIPDIMKINDAQFNMMKKANLTMDMKPYLDKYATDLTKSYFYSDGGIGIEAGSVDGKLLFLPTDNYGSEVQGDMLWIRKDWLDNIGMSAPKTIEEMEAVMDAFVNKDPNKDGKGGTYALGIGGKDNLIKDFTSVTGVFSSYHSMPLIYNNGAMFFEKDSAGNVIWSGSKPGVKMALTKLREWFDKGYLSKEFATTDAGGKFVQDLVASKFGMFYGKNWIPYYPLPDLRNKVPASDWIAVPPPTSDGEPTTLYGFCPVQNWYAVSKDCKNPEAVIKMLNMFTDKDRGPSADPENYIYNDPEDSGKGINCAVVKTSDPKDGYNNYIAVRDALKSKDPSKLNVTQKINYDNITKFMADPSVTTGWSDYTKMSGMEGSSDRVAYEVMKLYNNVYLSAMTDTMTAKIPTFKKMAEETIAKIIYGKSTVDEWDAMVTEWNKLGGDEILKEVQAYASGK